MGTVVRADGRVLMLRRQNEPYIGLWSMPGGKIHVAEHPDAAMLREFQEETGLTARIERFCGAVSEILPTEAGPSHFLTHVFRLSVAGGSLTESDEGPLQWLRPDELQGVAIPSDEWMVRHMLLESGGPRLVCMDATERNVMIQAKHP